MADTYHQAKRAARNQAECTGRVHYVLDLRGTGDAQHYGPYIATHDEELATYFCGLSDNRILFCTADDDGTR